MVTTVASYLHAHTGIDLSRPAEEQSVEQVDAALVCPPASGNQPAPRLKATEALYDAVVGVDRVSNCRFDGDSSRSKRLQVSDLRKLADIARKLKAKEPDTPQRAAALFEIETAATRYRELLIGSRQRIKKDPDGIGTRHTLVRSNNGRVFEMTNSMTTGEVARFQRQTGMFVPAVEMPAAQEQVSQDDGRRDILSSIVLGAGGYGKARIARDIQNDTYVAVKKTHPKIDGSLSQAVFACPAIPSDLTALSEDSDFSRFKKAMIVPFDECMVESTKSEESNSLAAKVNTLRLDNPEIERVAGLPGFKKIAEKIKANNIKLAIQCALRTDWPNVQTDLKSIYSFSELGIASVKSLIEHFNVLRYRLERPNDAMKLDAAATTLMGDHFAEYGPKAPSSLTWAQRLRWQEQEGKKLLKSEAFRLNDPIYNQRFLNTLARDMIAALATLHDQPGRISHRDIKPGNIVICQETDGSIRAKLIDLDTVAKQPDEPTLPAEGTRVFMPPEAHGPDRNGAICYDGQQADAYAMGMSLRSLIGFGMKDLDAISRVSKKQAQLQQIEMQASAINDSQLDPHLRRLQRDLVSMEREAGDNWVQDRLRVRAIMRAAPEAVSLKEIADLMLTAHPAGDRCSPGAVLKLPFFQSEKNFLQRDAFSAHAKEIIKFTKVIDPHQVASINDRLLDSSKNLCELRRAAAHAALVNRRQKAVKDMFPGLSKSEARKVDRAEARLKSAAGVVQAPTVEAGTSSAAGAVGTVGASSIGAQIRGAFRRIADL